MRGNVKSQAFIYLVKAKYEVQAMMETAKRIGLELPDYEIDDDRYERDINLHFVLSSIESLIRVMTNEKKKSKIDDGMLIETIMLSIARLNNIIDAFENIGLCVDDNSFDGHLYNSVSALAKVLDCFCGVDIEDEISSCNNITLDNYDVMARTITEKHHINIKKEIKLIVEEW